MIPPAPARAPWTVLKFGGAALADGEGVRRVCTVLLERGGARPLAVVSAALGVTNALEAAARAAAGGKLELEPIRIRHRTLLAQLALEPEMLDRHLAELATVLGAVRARGALSAEERDHVLSFGERMSARIVAAALRKLGAQATPVDAFDLGLRSDSNHGRARPLPGSGEAVRAALEHVSGIPVVTGFVAADAAGNLTTLGRNGSDLSASLVAEAVRASEVQFWKTVGGVLTADPRLVPDARPIRSLSYAQAAEYAFHGASVLHPDALAPLERANIAARVACIAEPEDPGTRIGADDVAARTVGVAARTGIVRASIELGAAEERGERLARVLAALERRSIEPAHVESSPAGIVLVVAWSDDVARALVEAGATAALERELALVSVVAPPERGRTLAAIEGEGIRVLQAWLGARASETYLVHDTNLARAARAAHACSFEACAPEHLLWRKA